jgi:23S rRNA (uracil1939-C5)-methyltransferase
VSADTIVRIAARGEGVTGDGRHVALAAPGDVIGPDGVVHPGAHHAVPPCRHFPRCGGCQLQHVDDAAYAEFIVGRISGALAVQGVDAPEIRTPQLSPPRSRRRATLRAERIGARVVIGFNESQSHRIVDMRECHVIRPELFALVDPLSRLLPQLLAPRRQASVALTLTDQGVDVAIEGVQAEGLTAYEAIRDFAEAHRLARLAVNEGYGAETRWEPEPATVTLGGVAVPFPSAAFLQATVEGEAALTAAVVEAVGDAGIVADLFAGLGTFALPLAGTARVLAVEGARDPALALRAAANRSGRQLLVEHRDLFRRPLSAVELGRFEAIVLDPPRAGAKEQAPALAAASAARLAYVSCNPATFARDAATLCAGGWRLDRITPVGQFRWSTHVELAAAFSR